MTLDSYAALVDPIGAEISLGGSNTVPSVVDLSTGATPPSTTDYTGFAVHDPSLLTPLAGTTLVSPAATTGNSILDALSGTITNLAGAAGQAVTTAITGQPAAGVVVPAKTYAGLSLTEWALIGGGGLLLLYLVMRK